MALDSMGIRVTQRLQPEHMFDKVQDAPEVMVEVGNVCRPGIRRDDDQRHAEAIHISRSPTFAIINDLWRRYMIVPVTPIVPSDNYRRVGPERAVANGVNNGGNPRGTTSCIGETRMIGILPCRCDPSHGRKAAIPYIREKLLRRNDHVSPGFAGADKLAVFFTWLAHVPDGIRGTPNRVWGGRIVVTCRTVSASPKRLCSSKASKRL